MDGLDGAAFLDLEDPIEQRTFWRARLDTRRWKAALAALLNPAVLRLFYPAALIRALPRRFPTIIRQRLERGFSTHPNRTNPYAWGLLLGEVPASPRSAPSGSVRLVHADAAEYLEACPPRSFNAFTLSNILDGAGAAYASRLGLAVERAAAPGAVTVLRSFAEPAGPDEEAWALRDRALLWGRVRVTLPDHPIVHDPMHDPMIGLPYGLQQR